MGDFKAQSLLLSLAAAVGLAVFLLVWGPASRLLGANSRLQQARPFFIRSLFIVLILGAIVPVMGVAAPAEESTFLDRLLWSAGMLKNSLLSVALFLSGFAALMAVLAASLGRYRDE